MPHDLRCLLPKLRLGLVALAILAGSPLAHAADPAAAPAPAAPTPPAAPDASAPASGAYCSGEYADDLLALSAAARARERSQAQYTFCIRTIATYECPSYGSGGKLRKTRKRVEAHGTGFAYRRDGGGTLLATNEHVAEWPEVTDEDHPVEGVPQGCRRVSDALKIVNSESDRYEPDHIPLTRVVVDPQLDVAVLRANVALPTMPWKIGRSAALRERNAVTVRGFPLGVLQTTNVGKVVSAYEHEDEGDWDHDDFAIDALLSEGNSGSPVFAVSCQTGELELVGIFHAAYAHASALNLVVSIDQVRSLLETLKRSPRPPAAAAAPMDGAARAAVVAALRASAGTFFPFGASTAFAAARPDGAVIYGLSGHDFPVRPQPVILLEDLPADAPADYGRRGRVWVGNGVGLQRVAWRDLDADTQSTLSRLLDGLRRGTQLATTYRALAQQGAATRARFDQLDRLEGDVRKLAESQRDLSQSAVDLADRICPSGAPLTVTAAEAFQPEALAAPAPAATPDPSATAAVVPAGTSASP